MTNVKIVAVITLIFTGAFTICLGTESSIKTLIGLAFFSLYFLIITVTAETDEKIDKIIDGKRCLTDVGADQQVGSTTGR